MRKLINISLLRDLPLALGYYAVCIAALWISDYPVEDWIPTSIVGYVALWLSRLLIVNLVVSVLRWLRDYGSQVADRLDADSERLGIDVRFNSGREVSPIVAMLAWIVLSSVVAAILGLSLTVAGFAVSFLGLAPLALGFTLAGLIMLGIGLTTLIAFFALSIMVFASAEVVSNKLRERMSGIEQSEQVVSNLLPANGGRRLDVAA